MKTKKVVKRVIIVVAIILILVIISGFLFVRSMMYPDVMKTGDGDIKVACVGDSITFSQGVVMSRKTDAYPSVLAELLGENYQTLNYGLPNRTLQSTGNMPYFEEDLAKESLESNADIVIFMLGTNDTKPENWDEERFLKEYKEAVEKYQNMESQPDVYIMIPPQIFLEETGDGKCSREILENYLIADITKISEETGAGLIDLYTLTKEHEEWFSDGLHPNKEGNREIAEFICSKIK